LTTRRSSGSGFRDAGIFPDLNSPVFRYYPESHRRLSRTDPGNIDTRRQVFGVNPQRMIAFNHECLIAMHLAAGSSEDPARHCARGLHSEEDSAGTGVIYGPMPRFTGFAGWRQRQEKWGGGFVKRGIIKAIDFYWKRSVHY
jgi:hypothetical protein